MKYRKLYTFLEQRRKEVAGFRYTDRSGWRAANPTYIDMIRPLWIIAEDPATHRRFWVTHEGNVFKISICQMDEKGGNIGSSQTIRCASRTDQADTLQQLFMQESICSKEKNS